MDGVWVPNFAESVEECVFFSVEADDASYLTKMEYTALFFHKLLRLVAERDEDLIEDIDLYYSSIDIDDEMSDVDMSLKIIRSPDFYYDFPPINEEEIECSLVSDIAERIDEEQKEEFVLDFEEQYNIVTFLKYTAERYNTYLVHNSEHLYDIQLSQSSKITE